MAAVMKAEIDENVVQNSVLPSSQLLRSVRNLIFISTTEVQVCHHAFPTGHLETTKRSRTEPTEGCIIDWELVVPLLNTVEPLKDHCVFNYQAIYVCIFTTTKIIAHTLRDLTC